MLILRVECRSQDFMAMMHILTPSLAPESGILVRLVYIHIIGHVHLKL